MQMIKKITIPYFPTGLKYATPLAFGAAIYLIFINYPVWGGLLILLGAIVLTTKYVTEIDLSVKKYTDYLSLMWIPIKPETKKIQLPR